MDTRLDLNLLAALDVLIAERNVTRAAQRLNLSQPALSAQLNRLRDIFGDQLLIPAQRGMIPTERALELQEPLSQALQQVRTVFARSRTFEPAKADLTFAVAASDYVQHALLIPLTLAIQKQAPSVRVAWYPICGRPVEADIANGAIHLWIKPAVSEVPDLKCQKLFRERYVCIARRGHPKVRGGMDLEAFLSCEHLIVSPAGGGFTGAIDQALEKQGLNRRVMVSVASFLMLPELVAKSDYISTTPERLVRGREDVLQILEPPVPLEDFDVIMLWHERTDTHPAMQWLREQITALPNV